MLYPLTFQPIFKERIWGGRRLEQCYHKPLPPDAPIGESWEIADRPGDESVIANGPLAGKSLRWLMENEFDALLGSALPHGDRFPLLVKILDARDRLSLQVHPPAAIAPRFRGEPKTELWYIAEAAPGAELFVGLKRGITREVFERNIQNGRLADCVHRVPVKPGDAMFLPSGRFHAIGAGLVIFEIQQNSDTTYRVFDWNRAGLDGRPRELHLAESLASINFQDFEPELVQGTLADGPNYTTRALVNDELFKVNEVRLRSQEYHLPRLVKPQIIGLVSGRARLRGGTEALTLTTGQFCLIPASLRTATLSVDQPATFLLINPR